MQELIVAVIVSFAALYLGAKYMPAGLRTRLVQRLAQGGRRSALASRLARWLGAQGAGACGGGSCSGGSCGSSGAPAAPTRHRVIKLHRRH